MNVLKKIREDAEALHKKMEMERKEISLKDELYHAMHNLSEEYRCAGWSINLEFDLWEMAQNGKPFSSMSKRLAPHYGAYLKELAIDANGWWIWNDDKKDKEFISLDRWKEIYDHSSRRI